MAKASGTGGPFRAPSGTRDVLPPDSSRWVHLIDTFANQARVAGFGFAVTPLFEETALFARGVGTSTDIVAKEMYEFEDKGGRSVALRPEATASVVRAFVEHRPAVLPWKVWYWGPMFRYERPQAGRYRQFHQLGAESIGTDDPEADADLIVFAWDFFEELGITAKVLRLNSLGDEVCRPPYRALLIDYLSEHDMKLCTEHRKRLTENPLRVLDCKKPECVTATGTAPRQADHLCDPCADAFATVRSALDTMNIPYRLDSRLVRGLDYYTRTTFEIEAVGIDAAQNAIGGGGRYDGLVEELGGPSTPAVGFSIGLERTLLAMGTAGSTGSSPGAPDVFVVDFSGELGEPASGTDKAGWVPGTDKATAPGTDMATEPGADMARPVPLGKGRVATVLAHELRRAGIACERDYGGRSPKAQFKAADRSGARYVLVIGPEEAAAGMVSVKPLREEDGTGQWQIPRDKAVDEMRRLLT